ncbi:MAG: hypothetical protein ACJATT_001693 [Myxococcota bacterium]|jgi:hypothetical protein
MIWLVLMALASADVRIEPAPIAGVESVITLLDDAGRPRNGIGVRVVRRDGLPSETQTSLGLTDSLGRVRWTPADGGRTLVQAGSNNESVRVGYASVPAATATLLAAMTFAGLLALFLGLRRPNGRSHRSRH